MLRIDHNSPELHPSSLLASHGEPRTKVYILVCERRLLRIDRRVLWYAHNAINVYHVVIPWRREVTDEEMGIGRKYTRPDKVNNKYDRDCHPKGQTKRHPLLQPARLYTEAEVSEWLTPESDPWYYAQGLTPPTPDTEKGWKEGR